MPVFRLIRPQVAERPARGAGPAVQAAHGHGHRRARRRQDNAFPYGDGARKNNLISEIKKIYDPEIPVNIYELGLIYKIEIIEPKKVLIEMTLTSPNCPVAESLPKSVKDNILKLVDVEDVDLKLVWDPPWTKDKMSEAAKLELNL